MTFLVTSRRGKASTLQTDTSNAFVSEENQQNFKCLLYSLKLHSTEYTGLKKVFLSTEQ